MYIHIKITFTNEYNLFSNRVQYY